MACHDGSLPPSDTLIIDCGTCILESTDACRDCVVTFVLCREPDGAVVVDMAEVRALRGLAAGGLVPALRHDPGPGPAAADA